jgi:site-specific DNA-cytosine methylase
LAYKTGTPANVDPAHFTDFQGYMSHDGQREHIDLFTGIGGFSLAAAANGIKTVAMCEIDARCRTFLGKAWPRVEFHEDIRTFDASKYRGAYLLTAGVPCQPASRAGDQLGADDDRWLWPEALRVLSQILPTWALFENPPGIGDVGLSGILYDVEAQNYEVRVFGIPACAVGSPQLRNRYWIVCRSMAYANKKRCEGADTEPGSDGLCSEYNQGNLENSAGGQCKSGTQEAGDDTKAESASHYADRSVQDDISPSIWSRYAFLPCADGKVRRAPDDTFDVAYGLHRSLLGALGNSIVPQVAAQIIKAMIMADEGEG